MRKELAQRLLTVAKAVRRLGAETIVEGGEGEGEGSHKAALLWANASSTWSALNDGKLDEALQILDSRLPRSAEIKKLIEQAQSNLAEAKKLLDLNK